MMLLCFIIYDFNFDYLVQLVSAVFLLRASDVKIWSSEYLLFKAKPKHLISMMRLIAAAFLKEAEFLTPSELGTRDQEAYV